MGDGERKVAIVRDHNPIKKETARENAGPFY
jgi:hypothetical protein